MKISTSKLKQIIQEELTSLSEQGLSASRMSQGETESENMAIVKDIIMLGLEAYASGKMSKEDEMEYGNDVQDVLERNVAVTKSIADIVREIELEGFRQDAEGGAPPGSALEEFDEEVLGAIERLGYDPQEGAYSARDVAGVALDAIDPEIIERVKAEISDYMSRATGIARDAGFE